MQINDGIMKDFKEYIGSLIEVRLFKGINKKKQLRGILKGYDEKLLLESLELILSMNESFAITGLPLESFRLS